MHPLTPWKFVVVPNKNSHNQKMPFHVVGLLRAKPSYLKHNKKKIIHQTCVEYRNKQWLLLCFISCFPSFCSHYWGIVTLSNSVFWQTTNNCAVGCSSKASQINMAVTLTCFVSGVIRFKLVVEIFSIMLIPANWRLLFPKMLERTLLGGCEMGGKSTFLFSV